MVSKNTFAFHEEVAWCPGCGNFAIREALQEALAGLGLQPHEVMLVTGIGQGAKMPHYMLCNGFNGLHGRALPVGTALRSVRRDLQVIVESGDGDTYGEGGNHFIHTIRRNPNIAHFVHNNQIYGLTKGQASPTSQRAMKAGLHSKGVMADPIMPLGLALMCGATFVARGFSGHKEELIDLMQKAMTHKGYALVDILQPCVSFNALNTFTWYRQRVQPLGKGYDPKDISQALEKAREWGDTIPTGILYQVEKETPEDYQPDLNREKVFAGGDGQKGWLEEMKQYTP